MSISINADLPTFTETQLHGLITGNYKEATTLRGWEAFKNFFIKLLNHLPGLSVYDKEQMLKNVYQRMYPSDAPQEEHQSAEKSLIKIITTLNEISKMMPEDDAKNIILHITESEPEPIGASSTRHLWIKLNNTELEPICITSLYQEKPDLPADIIARNMSITEMNALFFGEQETAVSSRSLVPFKNPDSDTAHIHVLLEDIIAQQNSQSLTKERCSSYITYITELAKNIIGDNTLNLLWRLINNITLKRDNIAKEIDFTKIQRAWNTHIASLDGLASIEQSPAHTKSDLNATTTAIKENALSILMLKPKDIKAQFEKEIILFTRKLHQYFENLCERFTVQNCTENEGELNTLIKELDDLSKQMAKINIFQRPICSSPKTKSYIKHLSTIIANAQQNRIQRNEIFDLPATMKKPHTPQNNLNTIEEETPLALEADSIEVNAEHLQRADSYSLSSFDIESLDSLPIGKTPVDAVKRESFSNEDDSGLSFSSSHPSSSTGSIKSGELNIKYNDHQDKDGNGNTIRQEIDIDDAKSIGAESHTDKKGKAGRPNLFKNLVQRVVDVENKRTERQKSPQPVS